MKKLLACLGVMAVLTQSAMAFRPSGWVYINWPWAFEAATGDWHWFNTPNTQWVNGFPPADGWRQIPQSALAAGWSFHGWPYAYSAANNAWYYINEVDTQWVVNMRTGAWSRFGVGATPTMGTVRGYLHNNSVRIPNHPVRLTDATLNPISEQLSDSNGDFLFSNVPYGAFGTYQIVCPAYGTYTFYSSPITVDAAMEGYNWAVHVEQAMPFISPSIGATLTSAEVFFQWGGIAGASEYFLDLERNTTPYNVYSTSGTSLTRTLPNGSYVAEVTAVTSESLIIARATIQFTVAAP